jgi:hypothetical protein
MRSFANFPKSLLTDPNLATQHCWRENKARCTAPTGSKPITNKNRRARFRLHCPSLSLSISLFRTRPSIVVHKHQFVVVPSVCPFPPFALPFIYPIDDLKLSPMDESGWPLFSSCNLAGNPERRTWTTAIKAHLVGRAVIWALLCKSEAPGTYIESSNVWHRIYRWRKKCQTERPSLKYSPAGLTFWRRSGSGQFSS